MIRSEHSFSVTPIDRVWCFATAVTFIWFMVATPLAAQEKDGEPENVLGKIISVSTQYGAITGSVKNANGESLIGASVVIKETRKGAATDFKGEYVINGVLPTTYRIEVSFVGYTTGSKQVAVHAGEIVRLDIVLQSAVYMIGGIEVVADQNILPKDPETKSDIRSGQIEHLQASSLSDVLQLVPGVKSANPGLTGLQQANIRGSSVDVSSQNVGSFGTQIIVDNVPSSNNANMQIDAGGSASSANRGVDLRSIPSENIENVEVIRGIPSAKYGDMTSGIIKVSTKTGKVPNRLKVKYNPNTSEGNYSGGFNAWGTGIGFNLNAAVSDRDIRKPGDGYTRIAMQISSQTELAEKSFVLKNIINVTRAYDEVKEDPSYAAREAHYDRDVALKYKTDAVYHFDNTFSLQAVASVGYTYQNSYKQQIVSRDNLILSDLLTNGTKEGRFVFGSYLSQYYVRGNVWDIYTNIDMEKKFFTGDIIHSLMIGSTVQYNANKGEGRVYDPLFPPSVSANIGDRPRKYDDLPGLTNVSLFLEDKISGDIGFPFSLNLGARYQMFNPQKINFGGLFSGEDAVISKQGSFVDPRVNLSFSPIEETQVRFGFGQTSKSPPLASIYPNARYYDVTDTVAVYPGDPSKNFGIVSTYVFDRMNESLRGYTQTKYEASIDQRIGSVGLSVTGFVNETRDGFWTETLPVTVPKRSWTNWPDRSAFVDKDTLMDKIYAADNALRSTSKGVELSMRTKRLPVINTVFEMDASYSYYETDVQNGIEYGGQRKDALLGETMFPMHHTTGRYSKELLLKYRFDVLLEKLGMWCTLNIEQQPVEIDGYTGLTDSLAIGYFTKKGVTVIIPEAERADPKYINLRRTPKEYQLREEDRPDRWLVNFRVSKELWKGTEVSFFVNNLWDSRPLYRLKRTDASTVSYEVRNPALFFGLEFSSVINKYFTSEQ